MTRCIGAVARRRRLPGSVPAIARRFRLTGSVPAVARRFRLTGSVPAVARRYRLPGSIPAFARWFRLTGGVRAVARRRRLTGGISAVARRCRLPWSIPAIARRVRRRTSRPSRLIRRGAVGWRVHVDRRRRGRSAGCFPEQTQGGDTRKCCRDYGAASNINLRMCRRARICKARTAPSRLPIIRAMSSLLLPL